MTKEQKKELQLHGLNMCVNFCRVCNKTKSCKYYIEDLKTIKELTNTPL